MIDEVNFRIFKKFRIKGELVAPYTGWLDSTRDHLAELYGELGYKVGAEVGVARGINARTIFLKNPEMKLFLIDPYTPYGRRIRERHQYHRFLRAQNKTAGFNAVFIKKTSMEALADIPDGSLDFVYIDGMHDFDNVIMDLVGWNRKVRSGGMVSGHDYVNLHGCGVIPAVNAFVWAHNIHYWYITREYLASWFWVKP